MEGSVVFRGEKGRRVAEESESITTGRLNV